MITLLVTKGPLPTLGFAAVVAGGLAVALLIAATPLAVLDSASAHGTVRRD